MVENGGDEREQSQGEPVPPDVALLDGASAPAASQATETTALQRIAADETRSPEERLEAYDDIIDSDVGDTHMSRARNIEREIGLRQIYLKFEGGNPSGTQKDRIAFAQARDALRRGFVTVTVATCGNYGAAMALAASLAGLRCHVLVPQGYQTRRLEEMTGHGADVERSGRDYEGAVQRSRELAENNEWYDANPGGDNAAIQIDAYAGIAYEIYDELRDAPRLVAVPVSNGTTLAGIYKGFLSLYRRGKTSRMPWMVGGSSHHKNPIVHAFRKNLDVCENLSPDRIRESATNEPLINWNSLDGDAALSAIRITDGWAGDASDRDMKARARFIRDKEGLHVLPASTAGLVALLERHMESPLPGDRYVVVLTGRRS